jgi:S-DNA-T family DNA segregation ATPase FtsK/SpoIIIE
MGDMLFLPPGTSKLLRLHGAFVSENEIRRIADFTKAQRSPVYLTEISNIVNGSDGVSSTGADSIDDEKYDEAVALVTRVGHASISLIQRHMRIGYNRAARIIETMEAQNLIGPSDGTSRPREVLALSLDHIPDRE